MKYIDADKLKDNIIKRYDEMLKRAKIDANNAEYLNGKADAYRAIYDLIDSLQQEMWKPNKEQMEALNALSLYGGLSYVGQQNKLISLYQDLKKLM